MSIVFPSSVGRAVRSRQGEEKQRSAFRSTKATRRSVEAKCIQKRREKRTMISAAALQRTAFALPVPLFGSVESAVRFGLVKVKKAPKFLPWGVPAAIGGLWFIWPAVQMEMEKGSD